MTPRMLQKPKNSVYRELFCHLKPVQYIPTYIRTTVNLTQQYHHCHENMGALLNDTYT